MSRKSSRVADVGAGAGGAPDQKSQAVAVAAAGNGLPDIASPPGKQVIDVTDSAGYAEAYHTPPKAETYALKRPGAAAPRAGCLNFTPQLQGRSPLKYVCSAIQSKQ